MPSSTQSDPTVRAHLDLARALEAAEAEYEKHGFLTPETASRVDSAQTQVQACA